MNHTAEEKLSILFERWCGCKVETVSKFPPSGSNRQYYRMRAKNHVAVGAYNPVIKENEAFIALGNFFKSKGLNVPSIYAVDSACEYYLLEDLGDKTLFDWLNELPAGDEIPVEIVEFYKLSITQLVRFQLLGKELDFSPCYPRQKFDFQSMMWDLQYFKYYFLKLAQVEFNEQLLENDFKNFASRLMEADTSFFLYRDFQSRNIMVTPGGPAFIDYQGGRQGALQYDIASLLYDAKANLPNTLREELLDYYIQHLGQHISFNRSQFLKLYQGYVLIRIMQAMGAYGYRGFFEKKEHFLKSIPFAINNLKYLMINNKVPTEFKEINRVLHEICESPYLHELQPAAGLNVSISSFSYKKGIPVDTSGHGGGFVFDCRAIENPGKIDELKLKTGKDIEIITFFANNKEMQLFLERVFLLVDASIEKYLSRGFNNLSVNFGCTGGRHRSVYCAERLASHVRNKFNVATKIKHVELSNL